MASKKVVFTVLAFMVMLVLALIGSVSAEEDVIGRKLAAGAEDAELWYKKKPYYHKKEEGHKKPYPYKKPPYKKPYPPKKKPGYPH